MKNRILLTLLFLAGAVPVYMGSPNADPEWIPGPHSVVKVSDFKGKY
jgi:hypothetical protein